MIITLTRNNRFQLRGLLDLLWIIREDNVFEIEGIIVKEVFCNKKSEEARRFLRCFPLPILNYLYLSYISRKDEFFFEYVSKKET